jgi:hypothetical protein
MTGFYAPAPATRKPSRYIILQNLFRSSAHAAAALLAFLLLTAGGVSVARADPCDDLAKQLASQISDLKVGATRGGVIYLEHPAVKQAWLGCSGRNVTNEISATTTTKKPTKEFLDFVSAAAALVFTIPKPDALSGAQRCIGRIGIIRGYNISTRYRKLDIRCGRPKDATEITISREKDS